MNRISRAATRKTSWPRLTQTISRRPNLIRRMGSTQTSGTQSGDMSHLPRGPLARPVQRQRRLLPRIVDGGGGHGDDRANNEGFDLLRGTLLTQQDFPQRTDYITVLRNFQIYAFQ